MPTGITAGQAFVRILADTTKLQQGLKRAEARLKAFGASAQAVGAKVAAIGVGLTAPFIAAAKVFADTGDQLDKMALRTGISVEALSRLGFAAEQSGADLATVEKGSKTLARSIFDLGRGLSTQKDAFGEIGLAFKDLQNLSPEKQFIEVAKSLAKVENASKRSALAQVLLGRAGQKLLPLFKEGAEGIEALAKEADDLGIVIDTKQAKRAAEFTDQLNRMGRVLQKGLIEIGDAVAPIFTKISEKIVMVTKTVNAWIKENKGLFQSILKVALIVVAVGSAIFAFGTLIVGLAIPIGIAAGAIGLMVTVMSTLATAIAFVFSPIGILIALVVGLGIFFVKEFKLIEKATDSLGEIFDRLKKTFGDAFDTIVAAVKAGNLKAAFDVLSASVKVVWQKFIVELIRLWEGLKTEVVEIAVSIGTKLSSGFIIAFQSIQTAFVKFKNKLFNSFNDFKGFFKKLFLDVQNSFIEFGAEALEFFGGEKAKGFADKIISQNNEISKAKKQSINEETTANNEANTKTANDELQQIQDAAKKRLNAIAAISKAARSAAEENRSAALKKAEDELKLAKEEMVQTIEDVKEQNRLLGKTAADVEQEAKDPFEDLRTALSDFDVKRPTDQVKDRLSARGSFTGFDIESRAQVTFQNESLKKQDEQIDELRKINKNTKDNVQAGRLQ